MTLQSSGAGRTKRGLLGTIVLILLGAVVLFVAGFGIAWIMRGGSESTADDGPTTEPLPCTTVTVVPGNGLPKPGTVTTNVYNATDRVGLAAETAAELKRRGFGIGKIANDPLGQKVRKSAQIRYGTQGQPAAELMQFYIPGSVLVADDRKDATIDTVLGEQYEDIASPAKVQKALTAPSPSPSGPGCASGTAQPAGSPAASPAASPEATPAASPEATPAAS
jgi:hypothetical protein